MSFAIKRRVVLTMLLASTVWPAAHFFVVRRLNLNPWNWFGWAMYTKPSERLIVEAYAPDRRSVSSLLGTLPQAQRAAIMGTYEAWSRRHLELGDFDDPDEFARVILTAFRGWESVSVDVVRYGLNRETATVGPLSVRQYDYSRAELGLD